MTKEYDPYGDNILLKGLGSIPTRQDLTDRLIFIPTINPAVLECPMHIRLHDLYRAQELYIPLSEAIEIALTIDIYLRQGYLRRNPATPAGWAEIYGEKLDMGPDFCSPVGSVVVGHSGVGKTVTIRKILAQYPQVIVHDAFPGLLGQHKQICWLSVEVPPSGKFIDLVRVLSYALDEALARGEEQYVTRFNVMFKRDPFNASDAWANWLAIAKGHFLGILHIDEVQNLYKLPTLEARRSRSKLRELSIVEDRTLRELLFLTNTGSMPLVLSGTPDGISALTSRFSTTQRFFGAYHKLAPFTDLHDPFYLNFLKELAKLQWVRNRLEISEAFAAYLLERTAGIPRLLMALWIGAQRHALERNKDTLIIKDFKEIADTLLLPMRPAVDALTSGDPKRIAQYDDMYAGMSDFWEKFWSKPADKVDDPFV